MTIVLWKFLSLLTSIAQIFDILASKRNIRFQLWEVLFISPLNMMFLKETHEFDPPGNLNKYVA